MSHTAHETSLNPFVSCCCLEATAFCLEVIMRNFFAASRCCLGLDTGCDGTERFWAGQKPQDLLRPTHRDRMFPIGCVADTFDTTRFLTLSPKIQQSKSA
jgi:hypothetical protein